MNVNPLYHQTDERMRSEMEWIERAKDDPEQFAPIYSKYHEQIFRYIYQRMDDQDTAFDITSIVFMKALKNLHKYEFRGVPFSSWLYRIAKSEVYQSFRNKKARRTVNLDSLHVFKIIGDFEEEEDNSENKARLIKCIAKLKDDDIQLLELRYFEERSYREIGEMLDITENNAKVKTFRAVKRLKKIFFNN